MKYPRSSVAVEGLPFVGSFLFLAWVAAFLSLKFVSVVFIAFALFTLYFFRDPERKTPTDSDTAVISPADGRIIEVENDTEETFLDRKEIRRVSIFMSPLSCHVNRSPVTGKVVALKYTPGRFIAANLKSASRSNERLAMLMETEAGEKITVAQVAGFIARRIVSYVEIGDKLNRGERFGMIRFGSRADLYLPLRTEVIVKKGDSVKSGETIIGYLKGENE